MGYETELAQTRREFSGIYSPLREIWETFGLQFQEANKRYARCWFIQNERLVGFPTNAMSQDT